ncbi:thiosulfohydrolase SoxB [Thiocapsa roseopersicina]|uniref:Sulfate thiol esterase SoxB n=1 Tax=Thiocapsa roseopersicina TaxID=1058 RepID=A0A1H3AMZ0_THIRO|nr:thiosulfohydrolase SoxB [Thiocapsa roseopersicina]SDX30993.1 sulfate thiol esterase SoxB [Thiocapsa roseopersicina]
MSLSRREFMRLMGIAGAAGMFPSSVFAAKRMPADLYEVPKFGNVTLLHITDTHAQLNPVYFREPNVNIGIGPALGQAPHVVGEAFLKHFGVDPGGIEAHAFTFLDFDAGAEKYGAVGGFAHLKTLVDRVRTERGDGNSLLLDGGDTWQGSGTAYWTRGMDMVGACNLLGVDVMTGHWEFTYLDEEVIKNVGEFKGEFVAQNVKVREEALFDYRFADFPGFDEDLGRAFKPYTIKEVGGVKVAVVGQAFPYTPIANPQRFMPDWTFGIDDGSMQEVVDRVREEEKPDLVVVLSHNGMDVDLKMASRVTGIDVIFGGHTHDGMPAPTIVENASGKTLVTNAGSNGKFLGVMDMEVKDGKLQDFRYRLLPVFSNLLEPNAAMVEYITGVRAPYKAQLEEELATAEEILFRRGNFNGTFDQVICDALRKVNDAQISLSPGFRWGTTVLPGQKITMDNVMDQTCITYPETYRREMTGADIKLILEDVCDNLFNPDPYVQQGGDMVRVGGLDYVCDPTASMGERILDMALDDGTKIEADKTYVVAGWATVGSQSPGEPIWETVATYLRDIKTVKIEKLNTPKLKNVAGNPGIADYPFM